MKIYILFTLFTFFTSCVSTVDTSDILTIDFSTKNFSKISIVLDDYVDQWQRVDLETSKDCLIDPSFNFYPTDSFIIAYSSNRILQFNYNGDFIHEISKFGEGPNEHRVLSDCIVDDENRRVLFTEFGNLKDVNCFDVLLNEKLPSIPISVKKQLRTILFASDSTLLCFPYLGDKKQIVYRQDFKGNVLDDVSPSVEDPSGPYSFVPISFFCLDSVWYYKGIYEDTIFQADNMRPYACFLKGANNLVEQSESNERNSLFLNHVFLSGNISFFCRIGYAMKETYEDIYELYVEDFRCFMFDHLKKDVFEVENITFSPLSVSYPEGNMNDLFSRISSKNPKKIVVQIPAEDLEKEDGLNPVLFIGKLK